jgi:hypothetical protein
MLFQVPEVLIARPVAARAFDCTPERFRLRLQGAGRRDLQLPDVAEDGDRKGVVGYNAIVETKREAIPSIAPVEELVGGSGPGVLALTRAYMETEVNTRQSDGHGGPSRHKIGAAGGKVGGGAAIKRDGDALGEVELEA